MTFSLEQIEAALDSGLLSARDWRGNFHPVRRHGPTRRWSNGKYFYITVKYGFRRYASLTPFSTIGRPGDGPNCEFIINTMTGSLVP